MSAAPFTGLLFHLRAEGVGVGLSEWMAFLEGLSKGLATSPEELHAFGRAVLCRAETEYDAYDVAFAKAFRGAGLSEELRKALAEWLEKGLKSEGEWKQHDYRSLADLLKAFEETLKAQTERHDGGSRWVGTGGTSPFGNGGRGAEGIRVGGEGGGRSAVQVAMERRWQAYRDDRELDLRDLQVVLRALRALTRDGAWELDLEETIRETARNAGEIELVEQRERKNRLKVVLLMDAGGSMAPHATRVERLFSAASKLKTFKTFKSYSFHNCVYEHLYTDIAQGHRVPTHEVLAALTPQHRLIFVGDASMAPYELFATFAWPGNDIALSGLDWLKRFRERCPAAIWLNPEPPRFWQHPTIAAIGKVFPMFELTVGGLQEGVRKLRAPL